MKLTLGMLAGITLAWCAAAIYRPTIAWTLTRIPPDGTSTPRYRTWHNGAITEGPWE